MYAVYAYVPIFCVYIHLLYRILKYKLFRIKSYYYYCFDYYLIHENLQRNNRNTKIIETYTVQEPPNLIARCAIKFNGTIQIKYTFHVFTVDEKNAKNVVPCYFRIRSSAGASFLSLKKPSYGRYVQINNRHISLLVFSLYDVFK